MINYLMFLDSSISSNYLLRKEQQLTRSLHLNFIFLLYFGRGNAVSFLMLFIMENIEVNELFDPDDAYNQMLELNNKASELVHSNKEYALKELKEIVKEITKLAKLRKDYYEGQIAELKNNQKDAK